MMKVGILTGPGNFGSLFCCRTWEQKLPKWVPKFRRI